MRCNEFHYRKKILRITLICALPSGIMRFFHCRLCVRSKSGKKQNPFIKKRYDPMIKKNKNKLRVYIIDAHVLMRQVISGILRDLREVAEIRQTGKIEKSSILNEISHLKPQLIFLGMENPDSAEMKIFRAIRKLHPDIPVVLVTPLDSDGAGAALAGLKLGAADFVTKPVRSNCIVMAGNHFTKRIVPIVTNLPYINEQVLAGAAALSFDADEADIRKISDGRVKIKYDTVELVAIGGCSGAVRSLYSLIKGLPAELPVPVVIVQHMPKIYTRRLVEELDKISPLHVREAGNNSLLLPGQVYLAPGGYHTVVKKDGNRNVLSIHRGPREHKFRPSIDVFFRSAVKSYNNRILGIILSGAGMDGVRGSGYLTESGGKVFVESEDSALFSKLPKKIEGDEPRCREICCR
jgi:two-component system, chemotaxis family, protein-glutamate methylesterase/glutaminase